jgi:sulfoxide reductase heme-binding subunit YedZ
MISRRLQRRLLRHHLPLGLVSTGSGAALFLTRPYSDVITKLSFASAWPGLVLISFTLLIGPFKQIWGRNVAISQDFRRDVGIWAGAVGVFHAVIGQCVHLRWRPWLYYIYEKWLGTPGWKSLQRWNYAVFGLLVIHTLAYQVGIEKPIGALVSLAVTATVVTLMFQGIGYLKRRGAV